MKTINLTLIIFILICGICFSQQKKTKSSKTKNIITRKKEDTNIKGINLVKSDSSKISAAIEDTTIVHYQKIIDAISQSILKSVIKKINTDINDKSKKIFKNIIVSETYPIKVNLLREKPTSGNVYDLLIGDEIEYNSDGIKFSDRINIIQPNMIKWVILGDGRINIDMNSAGIDYNNSSAAIQNCEVDVYIPFLFVNNKYLALNNGHTIIFYSNELPGIYMDGETFSFNNNVYIISNKKLKEK